MPSPEPKPAPAPAKVRNLTHESIVSHLEGQKAAAVAAVPQFEVVQVRFPKKNAKGEVLKDTDGFVELVEKTVLKRDIVGLEWDARIAQYA